MLCVTLQIMTNKGHHYSELKIYDFSFFLFFYSKRKKNHATQTSMTVKHNSTNQYNGFLGVDNNGDHDHNFLPWAHVF